MRLGLTDQELLNLPSQARSPALLPTGQMDYRWLINAAQLDAPTATTKPGLLEWLQEHQNAVFIGAGALLLVAVLGRRR